LIYTANTESAESLADNLANHGHTVELAHKLSQTALSSDDHPSIIVSDQSSANIATGSYTNIIHFELPKQTPTFQSRIINKGWEELEKPAAIIVGPHDRQILKKIEAESGSSFEQNTLIGLEPLNTYISTPMLSLGGRSNKKNTGKNQRTGAKRKGSRHLGGGSRRNNNTNNSNTSRQKSHKGPYGRLNGGIHRKRGNNPQGQQGQGQGGNANNRSNYNNNYQKPSFSEPTMQELGERESKKRNVVIRYKDRKRRSANPETTTDKPDTDSDSDSSLD